MTEEVELSPYDKLQIRSLATEAVYEVRDWGAMGSRVDIILERAWRLGFTAVSRGEQTEHPPKPDWMTDAAS